MKLPTWDQGVEDFRRQELECQRSAQQTLLGSALGENLEDLPDHHDAELDCQ